MLISKLMTLPFILYCADSLSILGRLDFSMMTHQALMEIFIQSVETKGLFRVDSGNYIDIEEWRQLSLNAEGEVVKMDFIEVFGAGTIDFEAIPQTVTHVSIAIGQCCGSVPWETLFDEILYWSLIFCRFEGTVNLTALPRDIRTIDLQHNAFSGTLNFSRLPNNLILLNLAENAFSGQINFEKVRRSIGIITLSHQNIKWSNRRPPIDMTIGIDLSMNNFSEDVPGENFELISEITSKS